MNRTAGRLEQLERKTGTRREVFAVQYEHEDFVKLLQPAERNGETMSLEDFRTEFSDGILFKVCYD